LVIFFFFHLNIIFNLSHPSNHSQTLLLSHPLSPLIHLKWTTKTSHCNPLDVILSLSIQSTLKEREEKEEENSSIFKSSLFCLGLKVISRLQLCPQFIFQLNYENDIKKRLFKIIFRKIIINKNLKIVIKYGLKSNF